jgi:hypothetical protein
MLQVGQILQVGEPCSAYSLTHEQTIIMERGSLVVLKERMSEVPQWIVRYNFNQTCIVLEYKVQYFIHVI